MRLATSRYAQRPAKFAYERHDCAVRALAVAADISYDEAHAALKRNGRKDKRATYPASTRGVAAEYGFVEEPEKRGKTLAQFTRQQPVGRYLVRIRNHALAVVDGVVHDWPDTSGPRSRVRAAYRKAQ